MNNNKPEGIGIGCFDENEIFNYQCYVYKLYLHVFKKKNEPESQEWSRVTENALLPVEEQRWNWRANNNDRRKFVHE